MTKSIFVVGFATLATLISGQDFLLGRDLQQQQQRRAPSVYSDDAVIAFKNQLGCGACIRGGYIYCIPGEEGSDPSTWGGKSAVCCRNTANCPQLSDSSYICSNSYPDPTLAKAMCPFKAGCGGNNSISFNGTREADSLNITIKVGDTCTYLVEVTCGLPAFHPNTTEGFEIDTFDSDEDDLDEASTGRLLGPASNALAKLKNIVQQAKNKNITTVKKIVGQVVQAIKNKGPQISKYNPQVDGALKKFKDGLKKAANETLCGRKRFQQISITALGDLATEPARILQSGSGDEDEYSMILTLQTTDFGAQSSGSVFQYVQLGLLSVAAIFVSLLF